MQEITLGLIGIGDILSAHLAGIAANPELRLVSVCRRSEEKLRAQADELGCKGFTDYHDLLADGPDVVLISLPHDLHCPVAIEAMEAGCHVIVEKPFAISPSQCNRMLDTAQRLNRHIVVAEAASFYSGAMLTGEKFTAGQFGRFFTGSIINERFYFHDARPKWFLDPSASGGGMFSNIGVHRLAIARACLPNLTPISVSASVAHVPQYEIEACTSAIVKYEQGGSMLYEEVGYYPTPEWLNVGTHFVFEQGIVTWDNDTWRMITRSGDEIAEPLPPARPLYAPIYANIVLAIKNQPYTPHAWEYAVDATIAQAAYASSRDKREIDLTAPDWAIAQPSGSTEPHPK